MTRAAVLLLIALASGCAGRAAPKAEASAQAARFPVVGRVAIAPLEDFSGRPSAPGVLELLIDDALRNAGVEVAGHLDGSLPTDRRPTPLEVQQAAAAAGATHVLGGAVTEYGFRAGASPAEPPEPIVAVELKLFEVATGRIVWAHGFHGSSRRLMGRTDGPGAVAINLARDVARALEPPPKPDVTRSASPQPLVGDPKENEGP